MYEVDIAGEAFGKQLDTEHKVNCPWRGNNCPESMVQFPPTPQSALIGGYKDRCDGLLQFQSLPIIAPSAVEQMRASCGLQIERLLSQSQNFMGGDVDFRSESIPELEASRDGAIYLYARVRDFTLLVLLAVSFNSFVFYSAIFFCSLVLFLLSVSLAGAEAHKPVRMGAKMASKCSRL